VAHFAQIENGVVTQVIVVPNHKCLNDQGQEDEAVGIAFCQSLIPNTEWVQTSYNGTIRKNYAGIGFSYDATRDAFIPPVMFPSWVLNEDTCQWMSPIPYTDDGLLYSWDEENQAWVEFTMPEAPMTEPEVVDMVIDVPFTEEVQALSTTDIPALSTTVIEQLSTVDLTILSTTDIQVLSTTGL